MTSFMACLTMGAKQQLKSVGRARSPFSISTQLRVHRHTHTRSHTLTHSHTLAHNHLCTCDWSLQRIAAKSCQPSCLGRDRSATWRPDPPRTDNAPDCW